MGSFLRRTPTLQIVSSPGIKTAVLIPVKAFSDAKARLAEALNPAERSELARSMATTVVLAAKSIPVWVVCDDDAVRDWALSVGAEVLWKPDRGLNGAVNEGVADLAERDMERVIVAHADLPHAVDLGIIAGESGVILVPDRHNDGTNVAVVPAQSGFVFSYGPSSFKRHLLEADRLGLDVSVVRDQRLGWDVDRPDDLSPPDWSTSQ
jgi:2-phospho-L-lactate guanylyltransferase